MKQALCHIMKGLTSKSSLGQEIESCRPHFQYHCFIYQANDDMYQSLVSPNIIQCCNVTFLHEIYDSHGKLRKASSQDTLCSRFFYTNQYW